VAAERLRVDDCLSVAGAQLLVEDCEAQALAERFGTPLHVVSADQLRRNAARLQAAFAAAWPHGPVRLLPALKANPAAALRRVLDATGAGCDAFGAAELEIALRVGTPPELISLNGPAKPDAVLDRAIAAGVRITVDDLDELRRIDGRAAALGRVAAVRLRLRPHVEALDAPTDLSAAHLSIADAVLAYKPGIPADDLAAAGARIARSEWLDARGVHMHFPRHSADPEAAATASRAYAALIAGLGWHPREIDVGGGIPVPRDPAGRALDRRRDAPSAPPVEAFAQAVAGTLSRELIAAGVPLDGVVLEVEPGRSLYGDAGVHLTRVRHVKRQSRPRPYTWIEVDTSEAFLPDGLLEYNGWTVLAAGRMDAPDAERGDVVGTSCGFDVLAGDCALPALEPGDLLAFLDTGAYQDAASSNFNAMGRPAVVLVEGGEATRIRRGESLEEVLARDVVPARLDHVGVAVSDLDRSLRFYAGLLGLRLRDRGEDGGADLEDLTGLPGARIRWADLDAGGGRVLELLEYVTPVAAPGAAPPNAPGVAHVGLAVPDLSSALERLAEAGVPVRFARPVRLHGGDWDGVSCLYASDPDGLTVELLERPAG
jgi:diaminopimelate decarboxylase